jgi:UDP-N-acetyl-D-galactosamine dehydrogenase
MNKNIYVAESLAVAEAAKVFENTQRDVNISLMNELSIICNKLNINTSDVLRAASTKWNFLNFYPGLVGGHCISVDPHYLSYCAKKINHKAILINTGRKINDSMVDFITKKIIDDLGKLKKKKIIVLGLAFKENCSDIRDSKIFDVIKKLKSFFIIEKHDPYVNSDEVQEMYNENILAFNDLSKNVDAIIINQKHDYYKNPLVLKKIKKLLKKKAYIYDLKGLLNSKKIKKDYKVFNL